MQNCLHSSSYMHKFQPLIILWYNIMYGYSKHVINCAKHINSLPTPIISFINWTLIKKLNLKLKHYMYQQIISKITKYIKYITNHIKLLKI